MRASEGRQVLVNIKKTKRKKNDNKKDCVKNVNRAAKYEITSENKPAVLFSQFNTKPFRTD